ncbi:exodeoxyribonuclease III [Angustibacter aerolatus]
MLRVVTANVNGVRAASRRGGLAWLSAQQPDVLCLQEVRADDAQLREVLDAGGFARWYVVHTESRTRGRAGVAVVTRAAPLAVRTGLTRRTADAGRWAEADLDVRGRTVTVVSVYVPTGEAGTPRQDEKERFLRAMSRRMTELRRDPAALALVTGDLNVAHREADLRSWRGNLRSSGFLPSERAVLDRWLGPRGGWVDVPRALAGDRPGPYTWWSWRGRAFDDDTGWRIDHQLATRPLAALARRAEVGRAATYAERWSDHAAVVVDYDL